MLAGDQAPSADLYIGLVAAVQLLAKKVAGWTSQAGGLIGAVGMPPAVQVPAGTAGGACGDVVFGRRT